MILPSPKHCEQCGSSDLMVAGSTYDCLECKHTNRTPQPPCDVCGKESVGGVSHGGWVWHHFCADHQDKAIGGWMKTVMQEANS